ncbi:unnamed protein product [Brassica rapa]|uniref:Uncharacterized protein n=2 Tax=Brassica TaxID=3705 RepID=A0A3P6CT67_BRACM|nr:unnamed protein product [Brassica napus]CAG7910845.1 unnamed protein product [Brassica rapa]VDD18806.1 unnamed protein product [Brassica rapa]
MAYVVFSICIYINVGVKRDRRERGHGAVPLTST